MTQRDYQEVVIWKKRCMHQALKKEDKDKSVQYNVMYCIDLVGCEGKQAMMMMFGVVSTYLACLGDM